MRAVWGGKKCVLAGPNAPGGFEKKQAHPGHSCFCRSPQVLQLQAQRYSAAPTIVLHRSHSKDAAEKKNDRESLAGQRAAHVEPGRRLLRIAQRWVEQPSLWRRGSQVNSIFVFVLS